MDIGIHWSCHSRKSGTNNGVNNRSGFIK
jgi:hypothetical protein